MRYRDLRIRSKIMLLSVLLSLLFAAMFAVFALNMSAVNQEYQDMIDIRGQEVSLAAHMSAYYGEMVQDVFGMVAYGNTQADISAAYQRFQQVYTRLSNILQQYYNLTGQDSIGIEILEEYFTFVSQLNTLLAAGENIAARQLLINVGEGLANETFQLLSEKSVISNLALQEGAQSLHANFINNVYLQMVLFGLALIAAIVMSHLVANIISKPLIHLSEAAQAMAAGDFNMPLGSNSRDEVGLLSVSMLGIRDMLEIFCRDAEELQGHFAAGNLSARINEDSFNGKYRDIAGIYNEFVGSASAVIKMAADFSNSLAAGDFTPNVPILKGDKRVLTNAFTTLKDNLINMDKDINTLSVSAASGDLKARIDTANYQNSWKILAEGLNNFLEKVEYPIVDTIDTTQAMAKGDFSVEMYGDYKGTYADLKSTTNFSINKVSRYIQDITKVLNHLSSGNLDVKIEAEYVGDFAPIKTALNKIIDEFNELLGEINSSSEQVSAGAKFISDSSMNLAQGATQQASSAKDLVNTIESVTGHLKANTEAAQKADEFALVSRRSASMGSTEMKRMLDAMEDINVSSVNISNIIKVIDDIAFQINLLALNAAVEAARAGQYGKGFAVVAEEVRNLASRSKQAAKETSDLIEGSVSKVREGNEIAKKTASFLQEIVDEISEVSKLIGGVAQNSMAQQEEFEKVGKGINEISTVTQTNSATAEEQAASAQQFSSQSEVLRNMISHFTLRPRSGRVASKPTSSDKPMAPKPANPQPSKPASTPKALPKAKKANTEPSPAASQEVLDDDLINISLDMDALGGDTPESAAEKVFNKTDFGKY